MFYSITPAIPEILIAIMSCVILLTGVFVKKWRYLPYLLAQITLLMTIVALVSLAVHLPHRYSSELTFHNSFILDPLALTLNLIICILVFFVFMFSRDYNMIRFIPETEFYVLGLLATLGMLVLVSGHNLITLYLGLELLSLPTYALVALQRSKIRCIEAAMKYFIMSALASGILLYGFSILFGITHSLDLSQVAHFLSMQKDLTHQMIATVALVFIVSAIAFKLGAVPFHLWVPDTYDGAPTSVTLFISTAPKLSAFALMLRLLLEAMPALTPEWQQLLMLIAIFSIGLGNLVAIVQNNIKRMLAYSSIAHIGYMLLGLAAGTEAGYASALFYTISYALMSLGAFAIIILLGYAGVEANDIEDFAGLNSRHPWLAFMMLLIMFSLAGIPPLVGFIAKVGILESVIAVGDTWAAIVAIVFSIIGSYYYIRVIKVMYFDEPSRSEHLVFATDATLALSITALSVLLLGLFPGMLFNLCHSLF